jgi:hypothetical protein
LVTWVFVKEKVGECKGKLKTNFRYEIICETGYSCVPKLAGMKVKVKPEKCRKNSEDISVPTHTVYKEEYSEI